MDSISLIVSIEAFRIKLMKLENHVEQLENQAKQVKNDEETRIAALEAALTKLTANK